MYIRKFFVCSTNHIIRPYSLKIFFHKHLHSELFYLMSGLSLVLVVTYSKADFNCVLLSRTVISCCFVFLGRKSCFSLTCFC